MATTTAVDDRPFATAPESPAVEVRDLIKAYGDLVAVKGWFELLIVVVFAVVFFVLAVRGLSRTE